MNFQSGSTIIDLVILNTMARVQGVRELPIRHNLVRYPAANAARIQDAKRARELGMSVEIPEPEFPKADFLSIGEAIEEAEKVGFSVEDGLTVKFSAGDAEDRGFDLTARGELAAWLPEGLRIEIRRRPENLLSWEQIRDDVSPEIAAFIDGVLAGSEAAKKVLRSQRDQKDMARLAKLFGKEMK